MDLIKKKTKETLKKKGKKKKHILWFERIFKIAKSI
jgi:hypothetical protein